MRSLPFRSFVRVLGAGCVVVVTGCELVVQLDRGLVDAGGDAPCAICSDAAPEPDAAADADASPVTDADSSPEAAREGG
jgi:hypothetical protein